MQAKIISSLEKCFLDETVRSKPQLESLSMLRNEICSFQVCYDESEPLHDKKIAFFTFESPLKESINLYQVESIPSAFPVYPDKYDDDFLRLTPGLYPDMLRPMDETERLPSRKALLSIWVEIEPKGRLEAGVYPFVGTFKDENGEELAQVKCEIEVIGADLPEQDLIYTQWFYTDCLMQYYNVPVWSEEHWRIIENFMKNARKYGMNMILTPLLSPELDTYVGGYRPATQLVDITLSNGKYTFCFDRFERWIEACKRVGIEYFEINHFFSQWGATACPQVIANVDGEEKRIFGWDTPSNCAEYKEFLEALLPAFIAFMKSKGVDKKCYYHISDEPNVEQLDTYTNCSNILKPLIEGYHNMDALSNYEFAENGSVDIPVCANDHIDSFIENKVDPLWTYYCCSQCEKVANRFFAMPSHRNRIIGTQMFKFGIKGFLHWGYNFYNNQYSYKQINPFICSDGECFAPSGDTYSVYPGFGGEPWASLRQVVFMEALQDHRALKLLEELYGKDYALSLIEEETASPITFSCYPKSADYILSLRRKINEAIKAKIK